MGEAFPASFILVPSRHPALEHPFLQGGIPGSLVGRQDCGRLCGESHTLSDAYALLLALSVLRKSCMVQGLHQSQQHARPVPQCLLVLSLWPDNGALPYFFFFLA